MRAVRVLQVGDLVPSTSFGYGVVEVGRVAVTINSLVLFGSL
jgi:hypothetical protein